MNSPLPALVAVDTAGTVIGWNPPATELLGHVAADVLGRDAADVLVPDDLRTAHRDAFVAAMAGGPVRTAGRGAHLPVRCADGATTVVRARFDVLRDASGAPAGAAAVLASADPGAEPFTPTGAGWPLVHRIVANLPVAHPSVDTPFWAGVLGLDTPMDLGWIVNHRVPGQEPVQVQVISRDASAVVDSAVSVEVTGAAELETVHAAVREAGWEIVHPLTDEPWGVRRFFLRTPGGVVVNVVTHP